MPRKGGEYFDQISKYFFKNYKYVEICQIMNKKYGCDLKLRTLRRILNHNGLKRRNCIESPLPEIVAAIDEELDGSGTNPGYRNLTERLRAQYHLVVKPQTTLEILRILHPAGVSQRCKNVLKRRNYRSPGPNSVWHIDLLLLMTHKLTSILRSHQLIMP